jgi:hypothetical protein
VRTAAGRGRRGSVARRQRRPAAGADDMRECNSRREKLDLGVVGRHPALPCGLPSLVSSFFVVAIVALYIHLQPTIQKGHAK